MVKIVFTDDSGVETIYVPEVAKIDIVTEAKDVEAAVEKDVAEESTETPAV